MTTPPRVRGCTQMSSFWSGGRIAGNWGERCRRQVSSNVAPWLSPLLSGPEGGLAEGRFIAYNSY